ncbi:MAG: hypothetical protein ACE5KG_01770 [Nitrososphaerales archaeon]
MSKRNHGDIEAELRNNLQQDLPKKAEDRALERAFEKYLELEPQEDYDPNPEKVRDLELELQDIITGRKNNDFGDDWI